VGNAVLVQLDPPIPVVIVKGDGWPEGKATCVGWIDYSQEHFTLWKCAFDLDGQVWDIPQNFVRLQANPSLGRRGSAPVSRNDAR
jgi:hypothetical protein